MIILHFLSCSELGYSTLIYCSSILWLAFTWAIFILSALNLSNKAFFWFYITLTFFSLASCDFSFLKEFFLKLLKLLWFLNCFNFSFWSDKAMKNNMKDIIFICKIDYKSYMNLMKNTKIRTKVQFHPNLHKVLRILQVLRIRVLRVQVLRILRRKGILRKSMGCTKGNLV
jgi:hypothetical protein